MFENSDVPTYRQTSYAAQTNSDQIFFWHCSSLSLNMFEQWTSAENLASWTVINIIWHRSGISVTLAMSTDVRLTYLLTRRLHGCRLKCSYLLTYLLTFTMLWNCCISLQSTLKAQQLLLYTPQLIIIIICVYYSCSQNATTEPSWHIGQHCYNRMQSKYIQPNTTQGLVQ